MSGRHGTSIWTPPVAFMAGFSIAAVIGGVLLTVKETPAPPPEVRTETVTETVEVPAQVTPSEVDSLYIQQQAALLPNTTFDDVRVATPLAVNVCENIRSGQDAADQPGVLEEGTYAFDQIDAWYFTELAIRTYCPEYIEDLP